MNIGRLMTIVRFLSEAREIMIDGIGVRPNLITHGINGNEEHWIVEFNYEDFIKDAFIEIKITELSLSNAEVSFNNITCKTTEGETITMGLFGLAPLVVNIDSLQEEPINTQHITREDIGNIKERVNIRKSTSNEEKIDLKYKVVWAKDAEYGGFDKETTNKLNTKYYEYGAKYEEKIKPI